jgi:hypothetical protein
MAGIIQFEVNLWPTEWQPWTSFYRLGEAIRERRKRTTTAAKNAPVAPTFDSPFRDHQAESRMTGEGCPNE